jgi:hypothetical protein
VNIVAGCASDVMLSSVQFSLKVVEPNRISRIFPGIEDDQLSPLSDVIIAGG